MSACHFPNIGVDDFQLLSFERNRLGSRVAFHELQNPLLNDLTSLGEVFEVELVRIEAIAKSTFFILGYAFRVAAQTDSRNDPNVRCIILQPVVFCGISFLVWGSVLLIDHLEFAFQNNR